MHACKNNNITSLNTSHEIKATLICCYDFDKKKKRKGRLKEYNMAADGLNKADANAF